MPSIPRDLWFVRYMDEVHIVQEIQAGNDRTCAIVGASYLDERLLDTIELRICLDETIWKSLTTGNGPLASNSNRILVGFALGLYDRAVARELQTIGTIRNKFAHYSERRGFQDQDINDLIANLESPKAIRAIEYPGAIEATFTNRQKFLFAIQFHLAELRKIIQGGPSRPAGPLYLIPPAKT